MSAPGGPPNPLDAELMQLADGFQWLCSLAAFTRLGLVAALEQPARADELAARLGPTADPSLVAAALGYLAARGVVAEHDGRFALTERGLQLAHSAGARALGEVVVGAYGPVFLRIGELIAGQARYGADVTRDALSRARGRSLFQRMIGQNRRLLGAVDKLGARRVVDLACGVGLLALDHAAREERFAVGIDALETAIAEARARAGDAARVRFVAGEPLDAQVVAEAAPDAEAITLLGASHECERLDDDALARFFVGLHERLPGRWLLVGDKEQVTPNERWQQALTQQGPQRDTAAWRRIFAQTPLALESVEPAGPQGPFALFILRT